MRGFVIFLVVAGIGGGLFVLQKRSQQKTAVMDKKFSNREKTTTSKTRSGVAEIDPPGVRSPRRTIDDASANYFAERLDRSPSC
ncbi:MAG: hypothetical protein DME41_01840 [Verrucomicrobia bacterium]|nr:MAG: hypothetical protein DME41_01840 [Verrucomicrobiota bacterium]